MKIQTRLVVALVALIYSVWASATEVRHFVAAPDRLLTVLYMAPAFGCLLTAIGHEIERRNNLAHGWAEAPFRRAVPGLALGLQYAGVAFLAWRAIWMFFSWDGMFFFPAWCALALTLYRWHPRWVPCS